MAHGPRNTGFHSVAVHKLLFPHVHHVDLHAVKTPLILLDSNIPRTILTYLQFRRSLCGKRKSEFLTSILGKQVKYRIIGLKLKNKISRRTSLQARFPGSSQPPTHPRTPGRTKERVIALRYVLYPWCHVTLTPWLGRVCKLSSLV